MIRRILPVVLVTAVALSGCVSLFPKAKPATLYRLMPAVTAPPSAGAVRQKATVLRAPIYFTRTSASDLIVTTTGAESASIKGVRWATPVQIMFDEAFTAAFDDNGAVNLVTRGSPLPPDLTLRVEVTQFAADYTNGEGSAPTVKVAARLSYVAPKDPAQTYETIVRAEAPAADNRVSAIVDAYNAATADLLAKVVAKTSERAALVKRP